MCSAGRGADILSATIRARGRRFTPRSSPHRQHARTAEERQELAALHEPPEREPKQYREMGGSRRFGSSAPNAARVLQRRMSVALRKRQLATKTRHVVKSQTQTSQSLIRSPRRRYPVAWVGRPSRALFAVERLTT